MIQVCWRPLLRLRGPFRFCLVLLRKSRQGIFECRQRLIMRRLVGLWALVGERQETSLTKKSWFHNEGSKIGHVTEVDKEDLFLECAIGHFTLENFFHFKGEWGWRYYCAKSKYLSKEQSGFLCALSWFLCLSLRFILTTAFSWVGILIHWWWKQNLMLKMSSSFLFWKYPSQQSYIYLVS